MSQHHVVLLLGSNLGNPSYNLENAIKLLEQEGLSVIKKTEIVTTKPLEFVSCNYFCNIATAIRTHFSPIKLLEIIKKIEKEMGRKQDSKSIGHYEDRIIDIDIVVFDNIVFESEKLEIPHFKHRYEREFSKKLLIELELNNT